MLLEGDTIQKEPYVTLIIRNRNAKKPYYFLY